MNAFPESRPCPVCDQTARVYCYTHPAHYYLCASCESLFLHPFPSGEEMRKYADEEYQRGLYKSYVQARDLKHATFLRRMPFIRSRARGLRLLDVGCSSGFFIDVALREGFDAHGVEFSASAIAAASEEARPRIVHGDVQDFPPELRRGFHVVTAFDIVEHTADPVRFLGALRDLLQPGGLLVLTTPDTGHLLRHIMRSRWPMLQPNQHTVLMSKKALRLALAKADFRDLEMMAARKVLTLDYLMQQVRIHNPFLSRQYRLIGSLLPKGVKRRPLSVNIGETMVFARRLSEKSLRS